MNRVLKVIGFIVAVAIVGCAAFIGYQMWTLGRGGSAEGVNFNGKTVVLASMAPMVIDFKNQPVAQLSAGTKPDEKTKRAAYEERLKLVKTWQNATTLISATKSKKAENSKPVISSTDVAAVAQNARLDAWGHKFCLFIDKDSVTALSPGPLGQPFTGNCEQTKLPATTIKPDGRLHFLDAGMVAVITKR